MGHIKLRDKTIMKHFIQSHDAEWLKSNCWALFDLQTSHQTNLFTRDHSAIYVQFAGRNSHFPLDIWQVDTGDTLVPDTALCAAS